MEDSGIVTMKNKTKQHRVTSKGKITNANKMVLTVMAKAHAVSSIAYLLFGTENKTHHERHYSGR